ncbi:MAG: F0F1 ATP synthase subunit B, partial [Neisseriaceae bacterium]|nr:F0F1 ATP synthase subunit B [Neisseriaceae bacterium]
MNINVTLIAQIIVFIVLVWFTMKFVWPPIAQALDERTNKIAEGLAAAERGKSDFEKAELQVAVSLTEGRQKVSEMIASADKRAELITENAKQEAQVEANKIIEQAQSEIDQEVNRAKEELRLQVAELAILGAEKILRREINPENHADILNTL